MDKVREDELIDLILKGDMSSYEVLIKEYEAKIYNLCIRYLHDKEAAYDVAQEVCLKIWTKLNTFKRESKLSTWIYRVTINECLDYIKKNNKTQPFSMDDKEDESEERLRDKTEIWNDLSANVELKEMQQVINMAIDELKDEYKSLIILRDIEGRSYEEIAEIENVPLGTIKSRLSRARNKLKKILEQDKEPFKSFFRHNK